MVERFGAWLKQVKAAKPGGLHFKPGTSIDEEPANAEV
jgi:hypothetical protein